MTLFESSQTSRNISKEALKGMQFHRTGLTILPTPKGEKIK